MQENIDAAIMVIGNEILSGKTQDCNILFLAQNLSDMGIRLAEVRIVADVEHEIIEAINILRNKYSYVFTTGGIGPTHDDITAAAIAKAFNLKLEQNQKALDIMLERYKMLGKEMAPASYKMADMPVGANLILNNASGAPGFSVGNVYVMAGIPNIMQAMFEWLKPQLKTGVKFTNKTILVEAGESMIAKMLEQLNMQFPELDMGSYPFQDAIGTWRTNLVIRGQLISEIMDATNQLKAKLDEAKIEYKEIE